MMTPPQFQDDEPRFCLTMKLRFKLILAFLLLSVVPLAGVIV